MDKTIHGIFNGEYLVGEDGKNYPVYGNYASKSCLVEGDKLKLEIKDGKFIYKQITLADRMKFLAEVVEEEGKIRIINEKGRMFGVLPVSITHFKLKPGDEVVAVTSKDKISYWATVEMVTNR